MSRTPSRLSVASEVRYSAVETPPARSIVNNIEGTKYLEPLLSFSFLAPCGIVLVGLLLRLWGLGHKSLWLDEIWSVTIARMPLHVVVWSMRSQDPNATLYYLLLHYWMRLGESEFTIRLFSALAGAATIPIVYTLGERLFHRRVGLIASSLLAVNLYHIQYSQEARSYGLVVLLVTLSSLFCVKAVEQPVLKNLVGYIVFSVLAVYAHVFALLVLVAHCASLIFLQPRQVAWRRLIPSAFTIGMLVIPLTALLYQRMRAPFVNLSWVPRPSIRRIYDLFYALAGNASYYGIDAGKAPGAKLLLLTYFVVCVIGTWFAIKVLRSSGRSSATWRVGLLLCWALVPIGIDLAVSLFGQSVFINRYLLICVPALSVIAALGIDHIKHRSAAASCLALIVGIQVLGLAQYHTYRSMYQEWRAATHYMLESARSGDGAIFAVGHGRLLFDYYNGQSQHASSPVFDVVYPDLKAETTDPKALSYFPVLRNGLLESLAGKYDRIWLVLYPDDTAPLNDVSIRVSKYLSSHYSSVEEKRIGQVVLLVYSGRR